MNRHLIIPAMLLVAAIWLGFFTLQQARNPKITISWSTETELDVAGYHVLRSTDPDGVYLQISEALIPASAEPLLGGNYKYIDHTVEAQVTYYYKLQEIETSGGVIYHGPITETAQSPWILQSATALILLGASIYFYKTDKNPGGLPE